jgi:3-dehydroquinate dehydratase / shikimate dehydrogenase
MPFAGSKICAVVAAANFAAMQRQLRRALPHARLIELRLDSLASASEILRFLGWLRRHAALPRQATFIATCRRRGAGGNFSGDRATQVAILLIAAQCGCRWIDLEWEMARTFGPGRLRRLFTPARCIVSWHEFSRTSANPRAILRRMQRGGGAAVKLALHTDSLRAAQKLIHLSHGHRNIITIPIGDSAFPARFLALREGSPFTYASVDAPVAPGQPSLDDAAHLYRAQGITRRTRIYGVIGNPIAHSLSPHLHNAAFAARGMDDVYLPFLVRDLRDFLAVVPAFGIAGFSVTLPHKQAILAHLDDCDPLAARIGSVNTVVVRGRGKLAGYNTDYVGVLRALDRRLALAASRVLILGAGGAARAVAFALAQGGAAVAICSRRAAPGKSLARAVQGEFIPRRLLRGQFFDAIVNATPLGMSPDDRRSPFSAADMNCRVAFDLVYRPRHTRFLQIAARRGIQAVSGLDMFLSQGIAQWEIWTGERAPEAAMRRAVLQFYAASHAGLKSKLPKAGLHE